jgi:hypothetical protein
VQDRDPARQLRDKQLWDQLDRIVGTLVLLARP